MASCSKEILVKAKSKKYNLIILDSIHNDINGIEVCKMLKNDPQTKKISAIMLIDEGKEAEIDANPDLIADCYVTKPINPNYFIDRIKRILHKLVIRDLEKASLKMHELTIDPARRRILIDKNPVCLTFTEFNILYKLAQNPGKIFTRYQIIDEVYNGAYGITDRAIDAQIVGIRKKLGYSNKYIETVHGLGYRFSS